MSGLNLSKEHGVNPSVRCCQCCGKDIDIVLFGSSYKDPKTGKHTQAPRKIYAGLCERCQSVVDQEGLIVIEVRDGETGPEPYRTGRLIAITKETKEKTFPGFKPHITYMEQTYFNKIFGESKEQDNVSNKEGEHTAVQSGNISD